MEQKGIGTRIIGCGKIAQTRHKDSFLVAEIGGGTATIKMPASINALVITLGDSSPSITAESSVSVELDGNGVAWN